MASPPPYRGAQRGEKTDGCITHSVQVAIRRLPMLGTLIWRGQCGRLSSPHFRDLDTAGIVSPLVRSPLLGCCPVLYGWLAVMVER